MLAKAVIGYEYLPFSPICILSDRETIRKGSLILRLMGALFPESAPVLHFNMFFARPSSGLDTSKLSAVEKRLVESRTEFGKTGNGYFIIQNTKVSMI